MSKTSPTQRSLAKLRGEGWKAEVVERWNAHSRTRKDLWGWCDILCLRNGELLAVQTTSYSNISARINKIQESDMVALVRSCNIGIHVHGWKKNKNGRWECTVRDIS